MGTEWEGGRPESRGEKHARELGRHYRTDMMCLADKFIEGLERNQYGEGWGLGLDDKRPFGNSDVPRDILDIIGYDAKKCPHCGEVIPRDDGRDPTVYAETLYDELPAFVQEIWRSKQ